MFGNISNLTYQDIDNLRTNHITESVFLDYKEKLIEDDKLLKDVCAFANTQGGFIIFGVKESGRGGYPTDIPGLNSSEVNRERIEQLIGSNILPRLFVQIKSIPHQDVGKEILLFQIPNSQYRPHCNNTDKRFYKRFNFQSVPMTEQEVSDAYKNRFYTIEEVENYIKDLPVRFNFHYTSPSILGNIIIIPSIINKRLILTEKREDFSWINPNQIDFEPSGFYLAPRNGYIPGGPEPSSYGIFCGEWNEVGFRKVLNIHRNGCVQYVEDFGYWDGGFNRLIYQKLAVRLLHTLQFAQKVLVRYNYFGDVRIRVNLHNTSTSEIRLPQSFPVIGEHLSGEDIIIDREASISSLETDYSKISASIMNEIFNYYGFWKCHLFDDNGNYVREQFTR